MTSDVKPKLSTNIAPEGKYHYVKIGMHGFIKVRDASLTNCYLGKPSRATFADDIEQHSPIAVLIIQMTIRKRKRNTYK